MKRVEPDDVQVFVSRKQANKMRKELETMFVVADTKTQGAMYSGEEINIKFPMVSQLFMLMGGPG